MTTSWTGSRSRIANAVCDVRHTRSIERDVTLVALAPSSASAERAPLFGAEPLEQRDRVGLPHGRMRREEDAFRPDDRRAAHVVGEVEPSSVCREELDDGGRFSVL